jgi:hypothetical protein
LHALQLPLEGPHVLNDLLRQLPLLRAHQLPLELLLPRHHHSKLPRRLPLPRTVTEGVC